MIGDVVGNFKIVSRLGRGGMGEVFLAEQQKIGTKVAIKMLLPELSADKTHVDRFFNEALAVNKIKHAGIVRIFDVGFHDKVGCAYLIMEFLEGESLATRISRAGRLPLGQICDIGRQIAGILEATHSEGITHRDLKPDNVFLVRDSEMASRERVKILDFGIAKLSGTLAGAGTPKTMGTMGTPGYMAPEQWGDTSKVDWRADVYSLGCLAYEMACGRPPFVAETFAEAYVKHLNEPPAPVRTLVGELPADLEALLNHMLAKQPQDRPSSMGEIANRFALAGHGQPTSLDQTMMPNQPTYPGAGGSSPYPVTPTPHGMPGSHPGPPGSHPGPPGSYPGPPGSYPGPPGSYPGPPPGSAGYSAQPPALTKPTTLGSSTGQSMLPPGKKSKAPIIIAVTILGLGGAGAAIYFATRDGDPKPEPVATPTPGTDAQAAPGTTDAAEASDVDAAPAEPTQTLRQRIEKSNPWVEEHGVKLQAHQVSNLEYRWYLESLSADEAARAQPVDPSWNPKGPASDQPITWVTFERARRFCEAIEASLPSDEQWLRAANGAWGLDPSKRGVIGPLEEWTATVRDGLALVRGAHGGMSEDDKQLAVESPMSKPTEALAGAGAPAKIIASAVIGFRCAR